ncbi:MFS transporter [Roseococcus sp. DSY-14]|uniref:MFS transporter n=1 Tax=Roseococcus sp. DSY-14 TaxID=3369650 RepID=UPI00387B642C
MTAAVQALPLRATEDWGSVAGAFLLTLVGFGAIYSTGAFAGPVAAGLGLPRGVVEAVYAINGGSCFLVSALSGPLADRMDVRRLTGAGASLVAAGLALAALWPGLPGLFLGYGLLVGLGAGCAYIPAMVAVQRGFTQRRGLASGLAVSGAGVGTAAAPQLAALPLPWEGALLLAALAALPLGLLGASLLRPWHGPAPARAAAAPPGALPRGLLPCFAGVLLVSVPVSVPHALLVGTALDRGVPMAAAVELLGVVGLGTLLGRFLLGPLADRLGRAGVFLACCACSALSLPFWAAAEDWTRLAVFALAFGAAQGGFVALLPAFLADRFGLAGLGRVMGLTFASRGIAMLAAPPLVALGFAGWPGMAAATALAAGCGLAGAALLAAVAAPSRAR